MSEIEIIEPVAFMKGRFNLFQTPDGGYHISYQKDEEYRVEGEPEIMHIDIPGFVINGAKMFAESGQSFSDVLRMGMEMRRGAKNARSSIGE